MVAVMGSTKLFDPRDKTGRRGVGREEREREEKGERKIYFK